jgi:hypothetical protein
MVKRFCNVTLWSTHTHTCALCVASPCCAHKISILVDSISMQIITHVCILFARFSSISAVCHIFFLI